MNLGATGQSLTRSFLSVSVRLLSDSLLQSAGELLSKPQLGLQLVATQLQTSALPRGWRGILEGGEE